ncbi:MAG: DNA polymerase IV [Clostridia bacterium]|nr:DNA polymerase IV [Clostridia bacterium]
MARLVFHVDVNSAFLSWEATRRVKAGEPDLRLIPSAVGGDREKRTGVILAKSLPAKAYGIKTGEPVGMALKKCPHLVLVKPDFRLYEASSEDFMAICKKYAPVVEKFSIDECFLDMSDTERVYADPVALAYRIKDEIRDTLGFTVNIGIGENKLTAKMAGDFEKPDKVHTLYSCEIQSKLWPLPVEALYMVGTATAAKLKKMHLHTIGQVANMEEAILRQIMGDKMGLQLHRFANGIDDTPVATAPREVKGYSNSTTLESDVTDRNTALRILLALADSVASRLRADGGKAGMVAVTLRSAAFLDKSHQKKLASPTDITSEIFHVTEQIFDELWDRRTPLRLLGVALGQIAWEDDPQLSLFDEDDGREKARKLDRVVDDIRGKFGSGAIVRGSTCANTPEVGRKHKAQQELMRQKQKMHE